MKNLYQIFTSDPPGEISGDVLAYKHILEGAFITYLEVKSMFRPFYSNFTLNICFVAALILCLKGFISYYGLKICTAPGIDTGWI